MGKGTIGGKIVLEGEKQYREALKNIKNDQTELRSEMKLCQTTFRDNQNSLEALNKKHEILSKQLETQSKKVSVYKQAIEGSNKKEQEAAAKISELKNALEKAEKEMQEMSDTSEGTSEEIEKQAQTIEQLKKQLQNAEQSYDKATQKTTSYKTSMNHAQAELQKMQSELNETNKYIKEASKNTDGCAISIDQYGKEVKTASEETSVFAEVLKANLTSEIITRGIEELANGIKESAQAAVEMGGSFEASMAQVAATMGMTAEEVENGSEAYILLSDAAKKCGKETQFSATESAEALNYLALAGYDAEKAAETLPKVLNLAAAGGLDLAYTSDLVTDSMAALGMETKDLDNYIDEIARTSQKSNTNVAQLGEATLVCAGTVSLTGQKLETMNTELGILANNGIKGAEGGTHLRNILLSLSAPTDKAAEAMKSLGLQVADNQGNMRDLNEIMIDLDASITGMSSTEKTQLINKIFNKTDIAAVNALLKGTGDEYQNLYDEISQCSGAAEDMAKTLNNNLKGKVTILQSALEGLGISAYELFDDAMKNAVDAATDAVGKLQKEVDSGNMNVSLNKLSRSLGEFCENAIELGEDALPVMIDGLTWILDNGDLIIAGITGIVAANVEMKVVAPAVEAVTLAWRSYQAANEGATVSQWLLNTAMNANPAGLLIGTITGLTAAIAACAIINADNLTVMDEVTEATKKEIEASKELNEQYAVSKENRLTTRQNMENEALAAGNLVKELKALESKTKLTASEQNRMQMIVKELNQAIPNLNLAINDQTGKLNMSTTAIEKNVNAMMAMARAEAAREDLTKIAEEQYEAEKQLAELEEQLAEQTDSADKALQKLNESKERCNGSTAELSGSLQEEMKIQSEANMEYEAAIAAQAELEEQIKATKESISGFTDEYENTMTYISDTEALATSAEGMDDLGGAAEQAEEKLTGMSDAAQAAFEEMYEELSKTINDQMSLFDKFNGKAELTTTELLNNMQSQVDGISSWSDNLKELAERGIDQGLLQHLADMGPKGAGYVATFTEMTNAELERANDLFKESVILPDETVAEIAEAYVLAGEQAGEGLCEGLSGSEEEAKEAGMGVAKAALKGAREGFDEHSPSKEMQTVGEYAIDGLDLAFTDGEKRLENTLSNLAKKIVETTKKGLSESIFCTIGKQIPEGLTKGIESGKSKVVQAIIDMCTAGVKAGTETLDINSPSKKFEYMGDMSGEGYITGWKKSMSNINAVIAGSLPDVAEKKANTGSIYTGISENNTEYSKQYDITQNINIYAKTDDLIETTRKFKESQKEAAMAW